MNDPKSCAKSARKLRSKNNCQKIFTAFNKNSISIRFKPKIIDKDGPMYVSPVRNTCVKKISNEKNYNFFL